jgi:cation diffusion facilitator CzcD-associated flavoprotein CzcO
MSGLEARRIFMATQKRPNVAVVGGGIGGLFAANALIAWT